MPKAHVLEKKKQVVGEITEKFKSSASSVVVNYRGLSVSEVTELRKRLREEDVEFQVIKNTLSRRATAEAGVTDLDEHLVGPTAIAFSPEDAVAAARVLHKYSKENDKLELKAGIVEGNVICADDLKELADLPSREGLLSMLLSVLQAPMRNFALAVKAVADEQESGDEAAES